MIGRILCAALIVLPVFARTADAQMPPPRTSYGGEPDYWVGLSLGYLEGMSVNDGTTGSTWQFGYTSQIRATFEKTIQRGVTVGVGAGFSTAPLTYQSGNGFNSFNNCGGTCRANADITQYLAYIRGGGGVGFHALYTLETGITEFSNFREQATNATLDPTSPAYDFTFGLGGGLGFGFSPTVDGYVGEQFDIILHPQGPNTTSASAPHQFTLRGGFRVGF